MAELIDVSVVIVSRDRKELLGKAMDSVISQNYPKEKIELIIVDDGSTKNNLRDFVLGKKKLFENVVYLRQQPSGPAAGRNFGASKASGKFILFTDNDCLLEKNWVKESLAFFSEKEVVCFEGRIITDTKRNLFTNAPENLSGGKFMTANMGFRKDAFMKLKGFNEKLGFWREDTELAFRAMETGKVPFAEKAVVYHPLRKEPWQNVFRYLNFLRNEWLVFFMHPKKFAEFVFPDIFRDIVKTGLIFSSVFALLYFFLLAPQIFIYAIILTALIFSVSFYSTTVKFKSHSIKDALFFTVLNWIKYIIYPFFLAFGFARALYAVFKGMKMK